MALVTIDATYEPHPDPVNVPLGGELDVEVPAGGCVICLETEIGGKTKHELSGNTKFDLKSHPNSNITYDVFPYGSDCPARRKRTAHSIKIGSGI